MQKLKPILRLLGLVMIPEGIMMLSCLIPAIHFSDGTVNALLYSGITTLVAGCYLLWLFYDQRTISDQRMSFLVVALIWITLPLMGTLPFLTTGSVDNFTDAFFESMSGFSTTGASIIENVEALPSSVLLWRSMMHWIGGFGIVLLVLALVPSLGLNKYSLYTAESSGADNTGKTTTSMSQTIRHTLLVYISLTIVFIILLRWQGMEMWDAVNMTFSCVASGGFSIYNNSIADCTSGQQYVMAIAMLMSGVNFALLYNIFSLQWGKLVHKLEQLGTYLGIFLFAVILTTGSLHWWMSYDWESAVRLGIVQCASVISTTGLITADTSLWWMPVTFLFMMVSLCGGMAGSTAGGIKIMRAIILFRNVRNSLFNRLHPHAVNPVRLNHKPVSQEIITNVMVIFFVYIFVIIIGIMSLIVCGVGATEAIGATVGCLSGYGPGLGLCGGLGNYAWFPLCAKWICCFMMIAGRLECLSVLILFMPRFWKR